MTLLPMLRVAICRVAAATMFALIAFGPGIARAAAWLSPVPLNSSTGSAPSVAVDATGNTIATWQTNPASPPNVVQGARHLFGATGFQQLPDFANDPGPPSPLNNTAPVVVTNHAGNGLVVWVHDLNFMGTTEVQLRTISPGGVVGNVQTVGPSQSGGYADLAAAINDNGAAIVAWRLGGNTIEATTRSSLGGSFTAPSSPALDTAATGAPSVAINSTGRVMALWPTNASPGSLFYQTTAAGSTWPGISNSLPSGGHTFTQPSLASNSSGQLVVAFQDTTTNVISEASGTLSANGFGMSPTINTLSAAGVTHGPSATVADGGAAIVGWAASSAIQYSRRPSGGSFPPVSGVQSITSVPVTPNSFSLAGNSRGDVIAAWYSFESGPMHNVVRAAVKPAGASAFGASKVISSTSTDSYDHVITVDQNGDGIVGIPLGSSGSPTGVSVAVYDASGPRINKPSGPTSLRAGTKASFSATSLDAFSGVGGESWSFGDGTGPSSGTTVSHTFDNVGRFTVKVTATDHAGNSSSATLTVTVTAPPHRCVVPRLKGKTLSQAKTALRKAHCKLGKVTKPRRPKHRKLRKLVVKRSSPAAGKVKPVGTKVALTLAEVPKKKHK